MRQQRGYIWRKGGNWYGRWWEDKIENGRVVRKQRARKLAECSDRYRSEKDVRPLLDDLLRPLNQGRTSPEATLTIAGYVDNYYLPYAEQNLKPSTSAGYRALWGTYLAPRLTRPVLRDFRTVDAANLLSDIHRDCGLGRTTLKHIKSLLSGVFTYAKNQGVLDGVNPVKDALIPRKAPTPVETHAATADEVLAVLDALKPEKETTERQAIVRKQARTAVALMFYAGLRPGETRGMRWEDYDGKRLHVRQSVWHTHTTEPKTANSSQWVPVMEPLRNALLELREADGNPSNGHILRGPTGKPLNLDNLARRVLIPALEAKQLQWHGWYSLRRGIATLLTSIEKDAMAAKGLLRHSSVLTTQRHYIKEVPENTLNAMKKVEALCNERATQPGVKPS